MMAESRLGFWKLWDLQQTGWAPHTQAELRSRQLCRRGQQSMRGGQRRVHLSSKGGPMGPYLEV